MKTVTSSIGSVAGRLDDLVASFVRDRRVAGAAAGVVVDQELAWSAGEGRADLDTGRPVDERTIFEIGSISKTFTATGVMQLRDEGRLGLEDPLVLHVPEFASATNPFGPIEMVTIRHLLQHSSGLQGEVPGRGNLREEALLARDELLASLDRVRVSIPPATAFKYSNLGYRLLGEVVRRVSGQPLHVRLQEHAIQPLGMRSTTDRPAGALAERQAVGYEPRTFDDRLTPARAVDASWCEGDGDIWSTAEDLARWIALQFRTDRNGRDADQVLAGSSLEEMQRATIVADRSLASGQGLGWHRWRRGDTVLAGHGGSVFGFSSHVCFSPEDRVGAIVLVNGVCDGHADLAGSLVDLVREHAPAVRRSGPVSGATEPVPRAWAELVGGYVWADFDLRVRIEVRDGRLVCAVQTAYDDLDVLLPTEDPLRFVMTEGRGAGDEIAFFRAGSRIAGLNLSGWPFRREELLLEP